MSQDRLRRILAAAAETARAHANWQDGDELVIILADGDSTVLHAWGFGTGDLAACLEFHAATQRSAEQA